MNHVNGASRRACVTTVSEEFPVTNARYDYADAFEISRDKADARSAEQWARDGFESLPYQARRSGMLAHRHLLGFRLGPWVSPQHIFGWSIAQSHPNVLHLEAKGRTMDGHMIWRLEEHRVVMTTFVQYNRPKLAAAIWAFAGRIHRDSVPGLLQLAASMAR